MPSLHVLKGPNAGQKLALEKSVIIIGREAKDCDVVIPNQAVSRVHAQITQSNGQFFIEDLKSRNHTFVNNKQVEAKSPLRDNDRVKICDSLFTFHAGHDNLPPLPNEFRKADPSDEEIDLPSTVQATMSRLPAQSLLENQPADRLKAMLQISSTLAAATEQAQQLDSIAEILLNTFKQADRCIIVLRDETSDQMVVRHFRNRRPTDEAPRFSRTIVKQCLEQASAFLVEDASTDSKFSLAQSITDFRIRSVMIAPLDTGDGAPFGAIQLDTQDRRKFTRDDLETLAGVARQASIAMENARLHSERARQARVLRDLETARQIQRSFLPQSRPQVEEYDFFAFYDPAMTIGGDYYDFIEMDDGKWAILLGDVAGKGVPAALLMARLSTEARFHILRERDPAVAFSRLNQFLIRAGLSDRFITLAGAILDPLQHTVRLINAGHLAPMIYHTGNEKLDSATDASRGSFPLGVDPDATYEIVDRNLGNDDVLLIFTDGVTDALDRMNKPFHIDGVRNALCGENAIGSPACSPTAVGEKIIAAVKMHMSGREPADDIALVSFGRFAGTPPSSSNTALGLSTDEVIPGQL